MKKVIAVIAIMLLIPSLCFATAATVTAKEFGYQVTGNTGATNIFTGKKGVAAVVFYPATSTDTATFTSGSSNTAAFTMTGSPNVITFPYAVPMWNLGVTMTSSSDIVTVFTN